MGYIRGSSEHRAITSIRTGSERKSMNSRGLSRAYLEATVDGVLSTPGAFDGAVDPQMALRMALTPEGRARKVHAMIHPHGDHQPDCVAVGQIADAIREAVDAESKPYRELLDKATQFCFRGPVKDLVIAARFDSRDEGASIRWVIYEAEKPKRLLSAHSKWENETWKTRKDGAFIGRTRMHFDVAFILVRRLLAAQRSS